MNEIQRIHDDFTERRDPFDDEMFPEEQLLEEVEPHNEYEKAMLLTAFCTLDYNRDATQLKDNLVELYNESPVWFAPKTLTNPTSGYTQNDLPDLMESIGFRYKNRDARGLWKNYQIISDKYGTVQEMIRQSDSDAVQFVNRLEVDGFLYLKGDKLAPFYTRVISKNIMEMDKVWMLDIPVDTHIRRLSKDLFDMPDASDDDIRWRWRAYGESMDISPAVVDGALWLIGNRWDDWGEDYWEQL